MRPAPESHTLAPTNHKVRTMALGATLKTAREAKGLTVAELANELHLKMQIVEDLENEDFSNIKASIYGRGFIKLCAERLGIDPGPLLDEFKDTYQKPSHEMAPYGTPEYRRQEELARARAAANVASAPPRQPKPILPSEPVDIAPKPVPTAGPAAPAAVVVSPAVPVEVAPAEPAAAPKQQAYDSKATPAAAPEQPTFDSKPAPAASCGGGGFLLKMSILPRCGRGSPPRACSICR